MSNLRRVTSLSCAYSLAPWAPVVLLSGTKDKVVRPARMREFKQAFEAGGTKVTFAPVPVAYGGALKAAEGCAALSAFIARHNGTRPQAT